MLDAFTSWQIFELLLIGAAAGMLGGLLGVGGGVVMIPALAFVLENKFGPESFHLYKLGAITTTVVLSGPAVWRHYKAGAIVPAIVRDALPFAIVGVVGGVLLSGLFVDEQTRILRKIFGGFLVAVVIFNIIQRRNEIKNEYNTADHCALPTRYWLFGGVVGFPAGLIAGFLGVGGGVWAVPSQRLALGVRLRNAIANSSTIILPVAVVTSLVLSISISQRTELSIWAGYLIAACLAPSALLGAWLGAGLTHTLPLKWLRMAFHVLLLVAGLRLMLT